MSRAVLLPFQQNQKNKISFVQQIANLASNPKNIPTLQAAGVMHELCPLLTDVNPSVQQTALLAIGRLANYSEELADSVIQNDIITQLISSLSNQNRFYKKSACFVIKSVAKHSPQLADDVIKCGALNPLVLCLEEFDPSVKESAAWALGYIAKHNTNLAHQVVEARAVEKLMLCLLEPEVLLKRASSLALNYICQHSEQLTQPVVECGLEKITFFLNYNDTQLKRNICQLLGNIAKHSADLATQILQKLKNVSQLLNCLKDPDDIVRKNTAYCICEIVNKSPENAKLITNSGGPAIIVDYISNIKGDPRLYGILSLGFISAFGPDLAMIVIKSSAINQLRDALQNEPHQHIKAASCYALGHIGRHSALHANEVCNANVLSLMLFYYVDPKSNDDLKEKAKKSLKKIIDSCDNLNALEPLIPVAPEKILKHILQRFVICLKDNKEAKKNFVNGGLQKLQEIKVKASGPIQQLISDINSYYDDAIIKYYSPDYAQNLLNKIDNYSALGELK